MRIVEVCIVLGKSGRRRGNKNREKEGEGEKEED